MEANWPTRCILRCFEPLKSKLWHFFEFETFLQMESSLEKDSKSLRTILSGLGVDWEWIDTRMRMHVEETRGDPGARSFNNARIGRRWNVWTKFLDFTVCAQEDIVIEVGLATSNPYRSVFDQYCLCCHCRNLGTDSAVESCTRCLFSATQFNDQSLTIMIR